uniref:Uncharacterized protein n=1 Tax=Magallana gigas TaxID=29159 RepID=K1P7E8_MAGGI
MVEIYLDLCMCLDGQVVRTVAAHFQKRTEYNGKENVETTFKKKIASIRPKRIDGIYGITKKKRLCSRRRMVVRRDGIYGVKKKRWRKKKGQHNVNPAFPFLALVPGGKYERRDGIFSIQKRPSPVGFLGFERSIWFHKALINGSQLSSLQNHLHLETASLSENHCAYRCLENQVCISFIDHESSGTCQLFGLGVDIRSKTSSGTITAYTKQVTCEDFGYVSLNSTKKCLKHHHVPLSWMDANNTCVSEGGNLFSITSLDMMEEVLNITFDKVVLMMFNYFIVVMIFSSLYMSRGQTTNKPLTKTRSVENTEEPRTTPKVKMLRALRFILQSSFITLHSYCFLFVTHVKNT